MGTKYSSQSTSGYNASPPADDGSTTEANKTKWSTILTKLTDILKTFTEAVNTELVEHFDVGPISKSTAYTTTAAENMQTIEVSGTTTITLGAASSMGAGYIVTIKNTSSSTVTVARSGADTIDGATSVSLDAQYDAITVQVNASTDGYWVTARDDPSITLPLPYSSMTFSNNIVAGDIAPDAIGSSEIAAGAVGTSEIAADSVGDSEVSWTATSTSTSFANGNTDIPVGLYMFSGCGSGVVYLEVYDQAASSWVILATLNSQGACAFSDGGNNMVRIRNASGSSQTVYYHKFA